MRTIFPEENGDFKSAPKDCPNIPGQLDNEDQQSFPNVRHNGKGKVLATIYKHPDQSPPYRLYWRARVDGKPVSRFKDFGTYSEAKREGMKVVKDLVKGLQTSVLSPGQATDALAAFQRLQRFYEASGRRVTLLATLLACHQHAFEHFYGFPTAGITDCKTAIFSYPGACQPSRQANFSQSRMAAQLNLIARSRRKRAIRARLGPVAVCRHSSWDRGRGRDKPVRVPPTHPIAQ